MDRDERARCSETMTSEPAGLPHSFWSQFLIWASRVGLAGKLAVALAVAAIGAAGLPPAVRQHVAPSGSAARADF